MKYAKRASLSETVEALNSFAKELKDRTENPRRARRLPGRPPDKVRRSSEYGSVSTGRSE